MQAGLYIVATPIGNLGDISSRAVETLGAMDFIAAEDTRVAGKLLSHLGIKSKLISLHDHNEAGKTAEIAGLIASGKRIGLISDAGTPLISDPGFKLVRELRRKGVFITSVPGACSAINALVLSGLPSDCFLFAGFVPEKAKARKEFFERHSNLDATVIFFESAVRLPLTLKAIAEIMPDRQITIAREMTKLYEEVQSGTASDLAAHFKSPKGEIVGLIAPAEKTADNVDAAKIMKRLLKSLPLKEAASTAADLFGLNKNEMYDLGLSFRHSGLDPESSRGNEK
ncbi:MAG: 16S rRNA (cytidine(1402)-2'-O)-methyltransferase [Alphaproteobacteria bacterium]|nr:16S rRNA (cytidine(1402)-2'-O)-methyltransferase [Alphaproteobacteria bacterium]